MADRTERFSSPGVMMLASPGWLNPLGVENVGTILVQWGLVLAALIAANRWRARVMPTRGDEATPAMSAAVP